MSVLQALVERKIATGWFGDAVGEGIAEIKRRSSNAACRRRIDARGLATINTSQPRRAEAVDTVRVGGFVKFDGVGDPKQAVPATNHSLGVPLIRESEVRRELLPGFVLGVALWPAGRGDESQFPL